MPAPRPARRKRQPKRRRSATAVASASAENPKLNASLADGSPIVAELSSSIDSKKTKQGDAVTARTTADIRAAGRTILPRGTKLVGHVTEAAARTKGGADSSLGIAFDKAILKGGEELPLNVAIVAVAPPQSSYAGRNMNNSGGALVTSPGAPSNMGRPGAMGGTPPATTSAPTGPPVDTTVGTNGAAPEKGLDATGRLTPDSRGVYGTMDASLRPATTNPAEGSVITSNGKNVHLDSDTQLLLVTQGRGPAAAPKS